MNSQISMLYIATFGRAPDTSGLDYWIYDSGLDIEDIAKSFFDQKETKLLYPKEMSTHDFIVSVYNNLFNRKPDIKGFEYWQKELDSDKISKSHFILAVINGALGDDAILLQNKTEIGLEFYKKKLDDVALAHSVLENVTVDDDSVTNSLRTISYVATNINDSEVQKIGYVKHSYMNYDLSNLSNFDTYGVKELDSGMRWSDDINILTYSFNSTLPDEYSSRDSQNWQELNEVQKNSVRDVMNSLSDILGVTFHESHANEGMIRFNVVNMSSDVGGYTYYPGTGDDPINGDVFLSQSFNTDAEYSDLSKGSIARETIIHEIGHALGLKHPFEGYYELEKYLDNSNHTVMSYTDSFNYIPVFTMNGGNLNYSIKPLYPNLYALYDIEALQSIYGANKTYNTMDNTYTMNYTNYKIYTIWDAGGDDTIDLSNNVGKDIIDLHDGVINSADLYSLDEIVSLHQKEINDEYFDDWIRDNITDLYNNDKLYTGKDNLAITKGVVIENLYTGINSDIVKDNKVDNHISTSLGDDTIYLGAGGYDKIDAGDGYDTVYLNMTQDDISIVEFKNNSYLLEGENFAAELTGVENIYFSINHESLPPEALIS